MRRFLGRPAGISLAISAVVGALLVTAPAAYAGAYCADQFSFSSATYSVDEGQAVTITVQDKRTTFVASQCSTTAHVQYSTSDGTAHSPGDYHGVSTPVTLTFTPGTSASGTSETTTETFRIQTVDNGRATPDENFSVSLSNPGESGSGTFAEVVPPDNATVTIHNVDKAPVATTEPAKNVSSHAATLEGKVNPDGLSTTYAFQYGKTSSYGSETSSKSAGSGSSYQGQSAKLIGLKPNTKYHYRIVATNSAGTTDGADRTFTTSAGFAGAFAPGQKDRMNSSGLVEVKVTCPSGTFGKCTGTLSLTDSSGSVISDPSFKESGGRTTAVSVKLTAAGQALVRKHGSLPVHAVVRSHDGLGNHRRRTTAITILAPRSAPKFTG